MPRPAEGDAPACRLTPLVYVPGGGTVFWENACASGSAAAGMYLAAKQGAPLSLTLRQPGGSLRVDCGAEGKTWLYGSVRLRGRYQCRVGE
jgi:diaminopimelate epimerase